MITFRTYRSFLVHQRDNGVISKPIKTLKTAPPQPASLYLKHDVEARVDRAVKMAHIEAEIGHLATYYFQGYLLDSAAGLAGAREIAELGHEVTYHFDVLDANDGNWAAAQKEFDSYCVYFADLGHPVKTVCPHGNPTKIRSGWRSNKDFFRSIEVRAKYPDIIDIVIDFPSLMPMGKYISDAGFKLRTIQNISDNDASNTSAMQDGVELSWCSVLDQVKAAQGLILSLHPHRFSDSILAIYIQRYGFKTLKSGYLLVQNLPFAKKIANNFYHLTRRF